MVNLYAFIDDNQKVFIRKLTGTQTTSQYTLICEFNRFASKQQLDVRFPFLMNDSNGTNTVILKEVYINFYSNNIESDLSNKFGKKISNKGMINYQNNLVNAFLGSFKSGLEQNASRLICLVTNQRLPRDIWTLTLKYGYTQATGSDGLNMLYEGFNTQQFNSSVFGASESYGKFHKNTYAIFKEVIR